MGSDAAYRVDYDQYFSREARAMRTSILQDLVAEYATLPDPITLHAGLPSPESFPAQSVSLRALDPGAPGDEPLQLLIEGQDVHDAQQYMFNWGHRPLLQWVADIISTCHRPPNPVKSVISSGAVNAVIAAISSLCDPGDYVLCEEYAYSHMPDCVFPVRGLTMLPVAMDEYGMLPSALKAMLAATPPSPVTGRPPRLLYIIPSGQNPTAAVMPLERKREIYQICREHGLIIIEDDAYYWLQFPRGTAVPEADQPGLQLPPTFLSFDTDGRVLRVDTFSKLLGPGYRLGWATGAPQLVAKVAEAVQAGSCGACSLSQVVVSDMLHKWGRSGFEAFLRRQQARYALRAQVAAASAHKHLTGLAEWREPRAGMFMWMRLSTLPDVDAELLRRMVSHQVAVVPGRAFWTDVGKARGGGAPCPYFRITFGFAPVERLDEGMQRVAAAIRDCMVAQGPVPRAVGIVPFCDQESALDKRSVGGQHRQVNIGPTPTLPEL